MMLNFLIITLLMFSSAAYAEDGKSVMEERWKKISLADVKNPVTLFQKDWAALASGNKDKMNAMTIGWGSIGVLWKRPVVTVYVAPERYTNDFMDRNEYFTVVGFPKEQRKALAYIGSHSGRDGDKLKAAGLTPEFTELGNPVFKEGNLAIECKTIYKIPFQKELLDDKATELYEKIKISPHVMYIGEVINVWQKEE
ncbi:MAG: flavin reductase family protein [Alphaproteobacteria bacterium]|nr:flavin reductase family protein [Alphaproteobacteria bacterium]